MSKNSKMPDYDLRRTTIREIIARRLDEFGMTKRDLATSGKIDVAQSTFYRFMSEECDTKVGNLEQVLKALGLRIVPDDDVPPWARKKARERERVGAA